ncbi:site-specific integrase [Dehalococcoidia bacterium]|nr:site-specific integrase [Dehalococcoidia bacterium]
MNLRTKQNRELFDLWRNELAFRYRSDKALKEAYRVITAFESYLGGYPPSIELAKSYLSQFLNRKPATLARYSVLVGQFMKWYGDPLDIKIKEPKSLPQTVDTSDVDKIEDAMSSRKTHKKKIERDVLLVETARLTGLRRSELANLKIADIDFSNRTLVVRGGKGRKDRAVPLLSELNTRLQRFCRGKDPQESVFGLAAVSISSKISNWAKKAEVPQIHAHSLRHEFGTRLAKNKVGARAIQSLLGHDDMATSQRYIDVVGQDLKEAIDTLASPAGRQAGDFQLDERGNLVLEEGVVIPAGRPAAKAAQRLAAQGT